MYAVQIHTLELVSVNNNEITKTRNLFLDISSEGQRPRLKKIQPIKNLVILEITIIKSFFSSCC
jgi:hypothetical protein